MGIFPAAKNRVFTPTPNIPKLGSMRNYYLKEMGIDVWVVRDRSKGNSCQSGHVDVNVPAFHLCFLNYLSFGVCLSLKDDQEVIAPSAKRFIADIALSVNGSARQPTLNNLKWPISGRESSDPAGKTAEEAVLYRLESLPGLVLVFGRDTVATIPGLEFDERPTGALKGRQILTLDAIDEICIGATGKRNLWRKLSAVRGSS